MGKRQIALYLENNGICDVDIRNIAYSNPGIGGSAYLFYLLAFLLSSRDNGIDVTLFTTQKGIFPEVIKSCIAVDFFDAWSQCNNLGIECLIVKPSVHFKKNRTILSSYHHTKIVIWCHNFVGYSDLSFYSRCDNIARLITVGREQMDKYRDHQAFYKTDYIYNCVDCHDVFNKIKVPFSDRKPNVTYMGAIIPSKGFHLLAKAWPQIIQAVPDANLYVIGNGRLYGANAKLGAWGFAEAAYENKIMKYLTADGKLLPSVHLLGVMGKEKYDVLTETKVGVPNPSGLTETFCLSAVDMQIAGARIVSKKCAGYLDTVRNGILVNKDRELARYIIQELKGKINDFEKTKQYIEEYFSYDNFAGQWEKLLLHCIPNGEKLHDETILVNPDFELKRYKERLRKLKTKYPFVRYMIPPLDIFLEFNAKCKLKIKKILERV
jgi:glycosyltransferase involved in cell wall biosynthesis